MISTFYLQDSNFCAGFLPSLAHPTQHFFNTSVVMCTCCGTQRTFSQLCIHFKGVPKHEKTPTIVYKGSSLHFSKGSNFLFFLISYPSIGCALATPTFLQKFCCAVFAQERHRTLASLQISINFSTSNAYECVCVFVLPIAQ